jgi:hypothetical protein
MTHSDLPKETLGVVAAVASDSTRPVAAVAKDIGLAAVRRRSHKKGSVADVLLLAVGSLVLEKVGSLR